MTVQGESRHYDEQALFALEIDGIEVGRFSECSEFKDESGLVEQREGGNKDVASKTDGIRTLTPITLKRGASDDTSMYDWRREVINFGSRQAEHNASIVQLADNAGSVKSRINLKRCWPGSYTRGPWNASSDETVTEETILHYHAGDWAVES